jgi:hypothetical protein
MFDSFIPFTMRKPQRFMDLEALTDLKEVLRDRCTRNESLFFMSGILTDAEASDKKLIEDMIIKNTTRMSIEASELQQLTLAYNAKYDDDLTVVDTFPDLIIEDH